MAEALTFSERGAHYLLRALLALPAEWLARTGGPPALNDRGEALDPECRALCAAGERFALDRRTLTPEAARLDLRRVLRMLEGGGTGRGLNRVLARTEQSLVLGQLVRTYVPKRPRGAGPAGTLVYLHGGGWVVGDLVTHDRFCRRLCADTGQIVVSVDYPLAPEFPYPHGLSRAQEIFSWLRQRAPDPERVALGGDSAGGNLSAAVCLRLRDLGERQPAFQLLVYPGLDLRCLTESYAKLGHGYILTQQSIQWYLRHYQAEPADPRASPLLEPDLRGLAPALIVTAGFDPLRDDGELYHQRLIEAGVPSEHLAFPSLVHGFIHMDGALPAADRALTRITERVSERWTAAP